MLPNAGWCDSTYRTYRASDGSPHFGTSPYAGACSTAYDFEVCWNNVSGNGAAWDGNLWYAYTNVCPAVGSVLLTVSSDEWSDGSWTVAGNTMRWWWGHDDPCRKDLFNNCPDARSSITNAAGDRYHFRFYAYEY
jgi:hypothetical protein